MTLKLTRVETAALVVLALQLTAAAYIATHGSTNPIPLHFNAAGEVDRWGDRTEAAGFMLFLTAMTVVVVGAISFSLRTNADQENRRRGMTLAQGIVLAIMMLISVIPVVLASPTFDPAMGASLSSSVLCLVLTVMGAVLGKVPPNAVVGVRTPWSLSSRLAWDRSNRLAGRLFFWGGLIALPVTLLASGPAVFAGLITGVLLFAALAVYESWRVWRSDPDRRAV
jgi:uncharacterized membrane protein